MTAIKVRFVVTLLMTMSCVFVMNTPTKEKEQTTSQVQDPNDKVLKTLERSQEIIREVASTQISSETTRLTLDSICDQNMMEGVKEWAEKYFAEEFLQSASHSVDTANRLYNSVTKQVDLVGKYKEVIDEYDQQVFWNYNLYFLVYRVYLLTRLVATNTDIEKALIFGYRIDPPSATRPTKSFLELLKDSIFSLDAFSTTSTAFLAELRALKGKNFNRATLFDKSGITLKGNEKIESQTDVDTLRDKHVFANGIQICQVVRSLAEQALEGKTLASVSKIEDTGLKPIFNELVPRFFVDFAPLFFSQQSPDFKDLLPKGCSGLDSVPDHYKSPFNFISNALVPGLYIEIVFGEKYFNYGKYFIQWFVADAIKTPLKDFPILKLDAVIFQGLSSSDLNLERFLDISNRKKNYIFHYKFVEESFKVYDQLQNEKSPVEQGKLKVRMNQDIVFYRMSYVTYTYFRSTTGVNGPLKIRKEGAKDEYAAEAFEIFQFIFEKVNKASIIKEIVDGNYFSKDQMAAKWVPWMHFLCMKIREKVPSYACPVEADEVKTLNTYLDGKIVWTREIYTVSITVLTIFIREQIRSEETLVVVAEMEQIWNNAKKFDCKAPFRRSCLVESGLYDLWFKMFSTLFLEEGKDLKTKEKLLMRRKSWVEGMKTWVIYKTFGKPIKDQPDSPPQTTGLEEKKADGGKVQIVFLGEEKSELLSFVVRGLWIELLFQTYRPNPSADKTVDKNKLWKAIVSGDLIAQIKTLLQIGELLPGHEVQKTYAKIFSTFGNSYQYTNEGQKILQASNLASTKDKQTPDYKLVINFEDSQHYEMILKSMSHLLMQRSTTVDDGKFKLVSIQGSEYQKNLCRTFEFLYLKYKKKYSTVFADPAQSDLEAKIYSCESKFEEMRLKFLALAKQQYNPQTMKGVDNMNEVDGLISILLARQYTSLAPLFQVYELNSNNFASLQGSFQNPVFVFTNLINHIYNTFMNEYTGNLDHFVTILLEATESCMKHLSGESDLSPKVKALCPFSYRKYAETYYFLKMGIGWSNLPTFQKEVVQQPKSDKQLEFNEEGVIPLHQRHFFEFVIRNVVRQKEISDMCSTSSINFCLIFKLLMIIKPRINGNTPGPELRQMYNEMVDILKENGKKGFSAQKRFVLITATEIVANIMDRQQNNHKMDVFYQLFAMKALFTESQTRYVGGIQIQTNNQKSLFETYQMNSLPSVKIAGDELYDPTVARQLLVRHLRLGYKKEGAAKRLEKASFYAVAGAINSGIWSKLVVNGNHNSLFALKFMLMYATEIGHYTSIADKFMGVDMFLAIPLISFRDYDARVDFIKTALDCDKWKEEKLIFVSGEIKGTCLESTKITGPSPKEINNLINILETIFAVDIANAAGTVTKHVNLNSNDISGTGEFLHNMITGSTHEVIKTVEEHTQIVHTEVDTEFKREQKKFVLKVNMEFENEEEMKAAIKKMNEEYKVVSLKKPPTQEDMAQTITEMSKEVRKINKSGSYSTKSISGYSYSLKESVKEFEINSVELIDGQSSVSLEKKRSRNLRMVARISL